jgi:hypothetical protein
MIFGDVGFTGGSWCPLFLNITDKNGSYAGSLGPAYDAQAEA